MSNETINALLGALVGAIVGGIAGFVASIAHEYLRTKEAQVSATKYWTAMLQVLANTANKGMGPRRIFNQRSVKQTDYFKLWYSRANDIWRMLPYMAENNPSLIEEMMAVHQFIIKRLAHIPPSDCDLVHLGLEGEKAFDQDLEVIHKFTEDRDVSKLKSRLENR